MSWLWVALIFEGAVGVAHAYYPTLTYSCNGKKIASSSSGSCNLRGEIAGENGILKCQKLVHFNCEGSATLLIDPKTPGPHLAELKGYRFEGTIRSGRWIASSEVSGPDGSERLRCRAVDESQKSAKADGYLYGPICLEQWLEAPSLESRLNNNSSAESRECPANDSSSNCKSVHTAKSNKTGGPATGVKNPALSSFEYFCGEVPINYKDNCNKKARIVGRNGILSCGKLIGSKCEGPVSLTINDSREKFTGTFIYGNWAGQLRYHGRNNDIKNCDQVSSSGGAFAGQNMFRIPSCAGKWIASQKVPSAKSVAATSNEGTRRNDSEQYKRERESPAPAAKEVIAQTNPLALARPAEALKAAEQAYVRGEHAQAWGMFMPLAEAGDPVAQRMIGVMLAEGNGRTRDFASAMQWFRRSANQGNAESMLHIAIMYEHGQGVTADPRQAFSYTLAAAESGNRKAMRLTGQNYRSGNGAPKNLTESARWFRKAYEAGDARAAPQWADMLFNGLGVAPEPESAFRILVEVEASTTADSYFPFEIHDRLVRNIARAYLNGYGTKGSAQKLRELEKKYNQADRYNQINNHGLFYARQAAEIIERHGSLIASRGLCCGEGFQNTFSTQVVLYESKLLRGGSPSYRQAAMDWLRFFEANAQSNGFCIATEGSPFWSVGKQCESLSVSDVLPYCTDASRDPSVLEISRLECAKTRDLRGWVPGVDD